MGEPADATSEDRVPTSPQPAAKAQRDRVPDAVIREVWARAGGICAFPGCPLVLYRDPTLRSRASFGEVAHNVAARPGGQRGHPQRSKTLSQDPDNLILLCPTHHSLVDQPGAAERYPDSLLAVWKDRHEAVIRMAGTLCSGTAADALVLQGPIGGQPITLDPASIPFAMLQASLVLDQDPTIVSVDASDYAPKSRAYWQHAVARVRNEVKFRQTLWGRQRRPIAVFALADMPTLMALGFALGHAASVAVFQFDPVPTGGSWRFPDSAARAPDYRVEWPDCLEGSVVLEISLSAPIERSRIDAALPVGVTSHIKLTVDHPTVDFVRGPATIDEFARTLRGIFARLETRIPKSTPVHVFPAMPASLAVTFGRFLKPKVSFPFHIYDAEGPRAPFAPAIVLPFLDAAPGESS